MLPTVGDVALAVLSRGDVRRLVEDVSAVQSPATAGNVLAASRRVLGRQVELDVLAVNPAAGVRAPSAEHASAQFLTPAEADRLQATADAHSAGQLQVPGKRGPITVKANPAIGPMVAMALATGLRLGELRSVVWGPAGIDLDARRCGWRRRATSRGSSWPPRTAASGWCRWAMTWWRACAGTAWPRRPARTACPPSRTRTGTPGGRGAAAAGLAGLRVHDLRHTAATFWLAAGPTVHAVAALLGHTDAHLVLSLYGHALPAEHASAGQVLDAWRAAQRA